MQLKEHVNQLQSNLEMEDIIEMLDDKKARFYLDGARSMMISQELDQSNIFECELLTLPSQHCEDLLLKLLEVQLLGQGTESAIIGLDSDEGLLKIRQATQPNCSQEEFEETLEQILNTVDLIDSELQEAELVSE